MTRVSPETNDGRSADAKVEAYLGWTGMVSASSLAHFQAGKGAEKGMETVEIDPQLAEGLGFAAGDIVRDTHT